jgi:tRNA(Ile)-lysidine synthase
VGTALVAERPAAPEALPLEEPEFAALMARFAPFERRTAVAVAVSGGPDSLSLALLAQAWARAHEARLTALIVDHGLRRESAQEARTVAGWLEAHGLPAVILRWDGTKPATGIQASARKARYRLLRDWCGRAGVLHLLLGHQRDDQAETIMLRAGRGSGADGLAGMAATVELPECRILRPLLPVRAARLRATLRTRGQAWIDDPSNRNPTFARVRVRAALDGHAPASAAEAGQARRAAEGAVAMLLARSVAIYPEGWATIDPALWRAAALDIARRALIRVLLAISGGAYPPRGERLDPVLRVLLDGRIGRGRTLAGCRLVPRGPVVVVAREAGRAERLTAAQAEPLVWDERFVVRLSSVGAGTVLAALGEAGWGEILAVAPEIRANAPPFPVSLALPALFDLEGLRCVPHLMYGRRGVDPDSVRIVSAMFRPRHALAGPGFAQS